MDDVVWKTIFSFLFYSVQKQTRLHLIDVWKPVWIKSEMVGGGREGGLHHPSNLSKPENPV